MTVLKSTKYDRVVYWGMDEPHWNKITQFPFLRGTMYRDSKELAAANIKRFKSGTEKALKTSSGLVRDLEPKQPVLDDTSTSAKKTYKGKAPLWKPADFSSYVTDGAKRKKRTDKTWARDNAFKSVKEDLTKRHKALNRIRKERGLAPAAPVKMPRTLVRVSVSRKEDAVNDLFNGQFQRVADLMKDSGYKMEKNGVRNYTIPNWSKDRAGALKKKLAPDYTVRGLKGEVVILLKGDVDIPVALINENGTLYQNKVKASFMVQRQVLKQETGKNLTKSESANEMNDVSHYGMYISRLLNNPDELNTYLVNNGLMEMQEDPHVTLAYSREPFSVSAPAASTVECTGGRLGILGRDDGPKHLVLHLDGAQPLEDRWSYFRKQGAAWDFPDFNPHVTICKLEDGQVVDCSKYPPFKGKLAFGPEQLVVLDEEHD